MPQQTLTPEQFREFLEHHGVKGMKWGVRKSRVSSTGGASKQRKKAPTKTTFQKTPNRLTDAQLNARIKRMELEKRYRELNKADVSEGKKFTKEVLNSSGKQIATTLIAGAALVAIGAALSKKMGPGMGEAITNRKIPGKP